MKSLLKRLSRYFVKYKRHLSVKSTFAVATQEIQNAVRSSVKVRISWDLRNKKEPIRIAFKEQEKIEVKNLSIFSYMRRFGNYPAKRRVLIEKFKFIVPVKHSRVICFLNIPYIRDAKGFSSTNETIMGLVNFLENEERRKNNA